MKCRKCGIDLPNDSEFCQYCGAKQRKNDICIKCGGMLPEGSVFCSKCGCPVGGQSKKGNWRASQGWRINFERPYLERLAIFCIFVLLLGGIAAFFSQDMRKVTNASKGVALLSVVDHNGQPVGTGSGFFVNDRRTVITNYHVIADAAEIYVTTEKGEKSVTASTVLSCSQEWDLAVLRCDEDLTVSPLELADSDKTRVGDEVYAVGYPLGKALTVSDGIVSSKYDANGIDIIQFTAATSPGSSGGPLLNSQGKVIGVTSAQYANGQNMNISIAARLLRRLISNIDGEQSLTSFYVKSHDVVAVRIAGFSSVWQAAAFHEKWKDDPKGEEEMLKLMDSGKELLIVKPGMWSLEAVEWCMDNNRCPGDTAIFRVGDQSILFFISFENVG